MDRLLRLQKMEVTEAEVYRRLAKIESDPRNKSILEEIAMEEERHAMTISKITGREVGISFWRVWFQLFLAKILGFTFSVKMMENLEKGASDEYRRLGLEEIALEEDEHERRMIEMLDEERLRYSGSVVLGMSDALVELTGALAGLTFALQDLRLVSVAGLVTGVSAAFSMGASEYLSSRAENKSESAVKAAIYTWISYFATVLLLISPYLIIHATNTSFSGMEGHSIALMCTFVMGIIIIGFFNFYISVVEEVSFKSRFFEMSAILVIVSIISFGIGIALRDLMGVEV